MLQPSNLSENPLDLCDTRLLVSELGARHDAVVVLLWRWDPARPDRPPLRMISTVPVPRSLTLMREALAQYGHLDHEPPPPEAPLDPPVDHPPDGV